MSDDDQRTLKEALSTSTKQDEPSISENETETIRKSQQKKRDRSSDRLNTLEEKVFRFESQLNALDQIPSNSELIDRAKQMPKKVADHEAQTKTTNRQGPILEVWQYTQMEKRIESAENGITRVG
jgi:thymidylate synthase